MNTVTIISDTTGRSFTMFGELNFIYKAFLEDMLDKTTDSGILVAIKDANRNEIRYTSKG